MLEGYYFAIDLCCKYTNTIAIKVN